MQENRQAGSHEQMELVVAAAAAAAAEQVAPAAADPATGLAPAEFRLMAAGTDKT